MRFMIIVPSTPVIEQGATGTEQQFADMQAYNEEMLKAGVFVDGEGLHPSSKGARAAWQDGEWVVSDGPFTESRELVGGFTIIDVSSREEALEWLKKWPVSCAPEPGYALELRQILTAEDFGDELTPELREREEQMRVEAARNAARG
jgi:hypothetical protein